MDVKPHAAVVVKTVVDHAAMDVPHVWERVPRHAIMSVLYFAKQNV